MATAALTASGCSTGVSPVSTVTSTTAETVAATAGREEVRVVDQDAGDVVLGVSNQSFDDPDVGLKVMVDDVMVVDGSFAVEGQHTVVFLGLDLEPGTHTLGAVSDSAPRPPRPSSCLRANAAGSRSTTGTSTRTTKA